MFKFTINNFRAFKEQEFIFSRINILIGENSAGKSSILKFLLALKQSFNRQVENELNLSFDGEYVDLGNYKEVVYNHLDEENIGFAFEFNNYDKYFESFITEYIRASDEKDEDIEQEVLKKIKRRIKADENTPSKISFELTKDLDDHKSIKTFISNPKIGNIRILFPDIKENSSDKYLLDYPKCTIHFTNIDNTLFEIKNVKYTKKAFLTLLVGSSLNEQIEALQIEKDIEQELFWNIAYLVVIQNYLEHTISNIDFVNPLHSKPERFYFEKESRRSTKKNDIEKLVGILSEKNFKEFINHFNSILSEYGIVDEIDITRDNKLPVRELRVKVQNLWSNITDVGYGVSLQLPIIFVALLAEHGQNKGQIILIEQPEVHLHPKLQAKFIEVLLKLGNNNIYFIETHSEYIIRKLQVIVKEEAFGIKSTDISINYLKRENDIVISAHLIDRHGRLTPNLPAGFFDNSYELAKELLD